MQQPASSPHLEAAFRYAPDLYFDVREPFKPIRVGITVFEETASSLSFDRTIKIDPDRVAMAIEYAIYWDYDIQHLYELEHVWVYIGHEGEVVHCECSYHGHYLVGLLRDRSNVTNEGRVKLFSQPGKHAMSPIAELFHLLPNVESCCMEEAGKDGLLEPEMFRGEIKTGEDDDRLSELCLKQYCFKPSFEYERLEWDPEIFVSWGQLREEIPVRLRALLSSLADTL
ncbi:hypothetical protein [Cohnella sp. WQ 127256]|uniref:hypothetical protein n=1 Tax=Cohnella sp. WQ 127256 TaxID=2938790 RepID=UPI002119A82F|nr:hypothetical protein [Cohnella sp. WQ 127256]